MLLYEIRKKTGEIPYKKRKEINEGVTLELEGDSVLIESFVLKEEAIKKLKEFKSEVREMHYSGTIFHWRKLIWFNRRIYIIWRHSWFFKNGF